MSRQERIIQFLTALRKHVSRQAIRLLELYDEGREDCKEAVLIKKQVQQARHVASMFYDSWYTVVADDDSLQYNFMEDSDVEVEQYISDYSYNLNLHLSAYGALPLTTINLSTVTVGEGGGAALPGGGGAGYTLTQDGQGNYIWVNYTTIEDNLPI